MIYSFFAPALPENREGTAVSYAPGVPETTVCPFLLKYPKSLILRILYIKTLYAKTGEITSIFCKIAEDKIIFFRRVWGTGKGERRTQSGRTSDG